MRLGTTLFTIKETKKGKQFLKIAVFAHFWRRFFLSRNLFELRWCKKLRL